MGIFCSLAVPIATLARILFQLTCFPVKILLELKTKYGTHNSPGTVSSQVRRFCPALLCHSSTIYCCVYYKIYQCGVDKYEKPYLHRIIVVFIVIF